MQEVFQPDIQFEEEPPEDLNMESDAAFVPLKLSYRALATTLLPFTFREAIYRRFSMICCCIKSCSEQRKNLLEKETIRNEALRSVFEDNLDIIELLKVVRLVQQTYTDKDHIMDEQERFEGSP